MSEVTGISISLTNCTSTLLREVAMKEITRNSLALTYAMALHSDNPTDWGKVNEAILNRWSFSGLEYIKTRAWKLAGGWKSFN